MTRIGLISALRYELPSTIPYGFLKRVETHRNQNDNIGVIVSGVGYKRAEKATERLCKEFKPDFLIMLGFCGCNYRRVNVGTLIMADTVHYNGNQESLSSVQMEGFRKLLAKTAIEYEVGNFQTFDHPVLSNEPVQHGVVAVDMEAFAVVRKAKELDVTPIIIKSVSDTLPNKRPVLFPAIRLQLRIYRNFVTAKKGLNDLGQTWFKQ